MNSSRLSSIILSFSFILISSNLNAQDINITKAIGKKLRTVISEYGKPAHQDRSSKEMECVFYKGGNYQLVFVANRKGVFQAEGKKTFKRKSSAVKSLGKIIDESLNGGYEVDTLNATEYNLRIHGVRANAIILENVNSQKFEVKVKADRCEG